VRAAVAGADVIHVHEPFVPLASLAAGRVRDAALVGTFHADPSPAMRRVYRVGGSALRRLLVPYRELTAVSPVAAAPVARLRPMTLVPNGLDLAGFDSAPRANHRAVFVGRDDPRKGLDVLLDAWRLVRLEVPDAELVVISDRSGNAEGVDFVGQIDDPTKRHLLAGAAVAVCPNLAGESFGMVVVEAMAAGCAVVASALPAFAHVLGEAGALAKPGDAEGLAATIVRVITDDDVLSTLQQKARRRVEQFDRHSVVAGYLSAYQSALAR
jgi:phosphatidylinositol alpha-mannosyltransferase